MNQSQSCVFWSMYHPACFQSSFPHCSHPWKRQMCRGLLLGIIRKGCFFPIFLSCHGFPCQKGEGWGCQTSFPLLPHIRCRLLLSLLTFNFTFPLPPPPPPPCKVAWKKPADNLSGWAGRDLLNISQFWSFFSPAKSYLIKLKTRLQGSKLIFQIRVFLRVI